MKRSGDIKWGQLQIGLVVAAAAGFLIWASMRGGENMWSTGGDRVKMRFHDVKGLVVGAPAKLNGFEVGQVKDISFKSFPETRQIEVTVQVDRSAWKLLRSDSRATITGVGFFGDKLLSITAGSNNMPELKDDEFILASEPKDFMETLGAEDGPMKAMTSVMAHVDTITARTARGQGSIGKALTSTELHDQMVGLAKDLRELSAGLNTNQDRMTSALVRMSNTVDSIGKQVNGNGSVGKMLRDPEMYDHFAKTSARMDSLTADLQAGKGSLGKVLKDDGLYKETDGILKEVHKMIVDMQANPKRYFKISVF